MCGHVWLSEKHEDSTFTVEQHGGRIAGLVALRNAILRVN